MTDESALGGTSVGSENHKFYKTLQIYFKFSKKFHRDSRNIGGDRFRLDSVTDGSALGGTLVGSENHKFYKTLKICFKFS